MKFAHIADTHIRNLKYHYEYKAVFEKLYEELKNEDVDYIIHCGDIAHTKTQISPEFVEMCTDFFRNLANLAPTYIILGNHDGNLKNSNRQDALTPIVDALQHPGLHLLKNSGETSLNDDITLNVLSVFDTDNWVEPSDESQINIALYHGSISGCRTDIGWKMEHGENDISIFDKFDYAFLGDIHKTNQILDEEGRIRYCGSTVQQNHGETNDKGFLIWEIDGKDSFSCRHIKLLNPKPFVSIELTKKGKIPKGIHVQEGARLRLITNNNLPLDKLRRSIDVAKVRFEPESITFLNRSAGERGTIDEMANQLIKEDLRNLSIQEDLIKKYLKDYEADEKTLDNVYKLNKKYNTAVEADEEISRNVKWKIDSFEWDNLFNYGENNKVHFENLNGIVGIFGKNFSGKSSIIDGLLYTIFNSTSKNERKNLNIINQNKEDCVGKVTISVGDTQYLVERSSEKHIKRLKGEETLEAKTNVDFNSYNTVTQDIISQNGLSRTGTDKNIRRMFGTLEDFLMTSMSSQLGSLSFINEGSTRRKEILAKFLDLEVFENKYKLAKEDVTDLRGALKRLEGKDYDKDIEKAQTKLDANVSQTQEQEAECEIYKKEIEDINQEVSGLEEIIGSIPAEIINIAAVKKSITEHRNLIKNIEKKNEKISDKIVANQEIYEKIESFMKTFDIEDHQQKKEVINKKTNELRDFILELEKEVETKKRYLKKEKLLQEVPCGSEYSHCKFIKDAYKAVGSIQKCDQDINGLNESIGNIEEEIDGLNPLKVEEYIGKYTQVLNRKNDLATELANDQIKVEKNKAELVKNGAFLQELCRKEEEYEENKEAIENLEHLLTEKTEKKALFRQKTTTFERCKTKILNLYKEHGSLEQKLNNLLEQKQEMVDLREEYAAYDLLMRCMHSNGIAYDIIKRNLPVINDEISKVLANIVEFEVFFESEDKKLDIFIKHPLYEPRPIEMGSGAEKTIAAMAIRLALLSVSSLPKSNIFIMDEPATALDAENMEGFVRILDMVKNYYQTVLLISHVDSLKDIVDTTIDIEKKQGFAYVNC